MESASAESIEASLIEEGVFIVVEIEGGNQGACGWDVLGLDVVR